MSGIEIREDNTEEVLSALAQGIPRGLEKCGLVGEGYAKKSCPVRTGRLRNSISHTVDDKSVSIGTNVEYGPYVELGTSTSRAQPFLVPAARDHSNTYASIIRSECNGS